MLILLHQILIIRLWSFKIKDPLSLVLKSLLKITENVNNLLQKKKKKKKKKKKSETNFLLIFKYGL